MKIKFVLLVITLICAAENSFAQVPILSPTPKATSAPEPAPPVKVVDPSAVSSLNRFNFYTGASFSPTIFEAADISNSPALGKEKAALDLIYLRVKTLYSILNKRTEGKELVGAFKKLQTSGNWNEFLSDLKKIEDKYEASLANEQKWYYKVGFAAATVQAGIKEKNHFAFILVDEDFVGFVKSAPIGTPPPLLASLKQTSEIFKNTKFGINSPVSEYAVLETQIKLIYNSIGEFKVEDKN